MRIGHRPERESEAGHDLVRTVRNDRGVRSSERQARAKDAIKQGCVRRFRVGVLLRLPAQTEIEREALVRIPAILRERRVLPEIHGSHQVPDLTQVDAGAVETVRDRPARRQAVQVRGSIRAEEHEPAELVHAEILAGRQPVHIQSELQVVRAARHRDGIADLDSRVVLRRRQEEPRAEPSHRGIDERGVGVVEPRALLAAEGHPQFVDRCRAEQARKLPGEVMDPVLLRAVIAHRPVRARLTRVAGRGCIQGGRAGHVVAEGQRLGVRQVEIGARREGPGVVGRLERLLQACEQVERFGACIARDVGQARKLDQPRGSRLLQFQRGEEEGRVAPERPAEGAARLAQRLERLGSERVFEAPAAIPRLVKRIAMNFVGSALRGHVQHAA